MAIVEKAMKSDSTRRGSVLLFCLGVLALLSMLGTALIVMTRAEQKQAQDYLDRSRALLVAESGVESAAAHLSSQATPLCALSHAVQPAGNDNQTPIRHLKTSSFGSLDLDNDGLNETAGVVSETFSAKGDRYRLRMHSLQSRLNINDTNSPFNTDSDPFEDQITPERKYADIPRHLQHPSGLDPDWIYPTEADFNPRLSQDGKAYMDPVLAPGRLFSTLSELVSALFPNDPAIPVGPGNYPATLGQNVATAIMTARESRPNRSFETFEEVKTAVGGLLSGDEFNRLKHCLCLQSWQDKKVLRPTFQWRISTPPPTDPNNPVTAHRHYWVMDLNPPVPAFSIVGGAMVRRPGYPTPQDWGDDLTSTVQFDFDRDGTREIVNHDRDIYFFSDMQTRYFDLEARSPVDVNGASRELLQALIAPVKGWYLKEAPSTWDGENIRSRAEDWSQCCDQNPVGGGFRNVFGFAWLGIGRVGLLNFSLLGMAPGYGSAGWETVDQSQYYYYDGYFKHYIQYIESSNVTRMEFAAKSARFGELSQSKAFNVPIGGTGPTVAKLLSEAIYNRVHPDPSNPDQQAPFRSWQEFESFLLDLADGDGANDLTNNPADFDVYMAQTLLANFDPNSRLNDYNPNKLLHRHVDKSQLIGFSTELCFHPMGYFDLESFGEVLGADGRPLSSSTVHSRIKTMEILRVTNQSQFMKDFDSISLNENFYFSESDDISPTHGARPGFNGCALQSYPEPQSRRFNFFPDSIYDGCLMLATLQPDRADFFQEDPIPGPVNNRFYASFTGLLDANHSDLSRGVCIGDAGTDKWTFDAWECGEYTMDRIAEGGGWIGEPNCKVPANHPEDKALCRSLRELENPDSSLDAPGCLLPDGVLSDTGRCPRYESINIGNPNRDAGNQFIRGRQGSLQFWVKPNFDTTHANRVRCLFAAPPRVDRQPAHYLETTSFAVNGNSCYGPLTKGDPCQSFHLYYFAHGGMRTPLNAQGRLDDNVNLSYQPSWDLHGGRWIPTRALFLTAGEFWISINGGNQISGISTSTANQDWRAAADQASPNIPEFNLQSHQWSHVSFSWDWLGRYVGAPGGTLAGAYIGPARYSRLALNGKYVLGDREWFPPVGVNANGAFGTATYRISNGIHESREATPTPNYARFGESSSNPWRNDVADSTFDDIVSNSLMKADNDLLAEFGYGRYYSKSGATYTSPEFNLFEEFSNSALSLTLKYIAWTLYWPLQEENSLKAGSLRHNDNLHFNNSDFYTSLIGTTKPLASPFADDPMTSIWGANYTPLKVNLFQSQLGWYYGPAAPISEELMPCDPAGSQDPAWKNRPLRYVKGQSPIFRFQTIFLFEDEAQSPVLYSSPVLDDMTFLFELNSPEILSWELE